MRFIVDECVGPSVAEFLKEMGHDVISIFDEHRGMGDIDILKMAVKKDYIVLTDDKDFGELVFKLKMSHKGIILLRLNDNRYKNKISVIKKLLLGYSGRLSGNFIVVTEDSVRITENQ